MKHNLSGFPWVNRCHHRRFLALDLSPDNFHSFVDSLSLSIKPSTTPAGGSGVCIVGPFTSSSKHSTSTYASGYSLARSHTSFGGYGAPDSNFNSPIISREREYVIYGVLPCCLGSTSTRTRTIHHRLPPDTTHLIRAHVSYNTHTIQCLKLFIIPNATWLACGPGSSSKG